MRANLASCARPSGYPGNRRSRRVANPPQDSNQPHMRRNIFTRSRHQASQYREGVHPVPPVKLVFPLCASSPETSPQLVDSSSQHRSVAFSGRVPSGRPPFLGAFFRVARPLPPRSSSVTLNSAFSALLSSSILLFFTSFMPPSTT